MNQITTGHFEDGKTERLDSSIALPEVGQWYWDGTISGLFTLCAGSLGV